jgi:hypothetical protein
MVPDCLVTGTIERVIGLRRRVAEESQDGPFTLHGDGHSANIVHDYNIMIGLWNMGMTRNQNQIITRWKVSMCLKFIRLLQFYRSHSLLGLAIEYSS